MIQLDKPMLSILEINLFIYSSKYFTKFLKMKPPNLTRTHLETFYV